MSYINFGIDEATLNSINNNDQQIQYPQYIDNSKREGYDNLTKIEVLEQGERERNININYTTPELIDNLKYDPNINDLVQEEEFMPKFDAPKLPEKIKRASKRYDDNENENENENENINKNNKSQSINDSQNHSMSEELSSYKNEHIISVKKIKFNKYKQELRSRNRDSSNGGLYPQDNYSKKKTNSSFYGNGKNLNNQQFYNKNNYETVFIPRVMFFQKYGNHLYQDQYQNEYEYEDEIPRIMFFQKGNEYLIENKSLNRNNNKKELEEIPSGEYSKYNGEQKLFAFPGRGRGLGMDKGEYIFEGGKMKLVERDISEEKVKIEEEEIYKEINRRKEHYSKEKKLNYKVIDKFYITTEVGRESVTSNSEEHPDRAKNSNQNQNNIDFFKNTNDNTDLFPTDNYSKYIFTQINKIRTDPQSIIGIIEDAKDHIIEDKYGRIIYDRDLKIALTKGKYAFDDTIEFLEKQKPMKSLEYKPIITIKPPSEEKVIEDKTYMKKEVRKMMKNGISIKSYWRDVIRDPEISFILMIADDNGAKSGKRRNDILDPNMKYIGISSVEINDSFACYIVLSTGD